MRLAGFTIALTTAALAAVAVAQTPEAGLPAGPGKDLVSAKCSTCHGLGTVLVAKRTRAQWSDTVDRMLDKGLVASDAEVDQVVDYLASALPAPVEPVAPSPAPSSTAP